jgi:hypothetical protein
VECLSTVPLGVEVVVVVVVCDEDVVGGGWITGAGGGGVPLYSVVLVVVSLLAVPQAEQNPIASVAVLITIQRPTLSLISNSPYFVVQPLLKCNIRRLRC